MVDLVLNNLTTDKSYSSDFFEKILQKAVAILGIGNKKLEISINLVGRGRIKALNKKYLRKNRITDVLSFPLADKNDAKLLKENDIIALGDIFICLPVAKKQALEKGESLDKQLALLTVHGLLHLLGYDHEKSTEEAKKMYQLQEEILKESF
jgi:probable rRNA maturation factor